MSKVYFGGSRSLPYQNQNSALHQVVSAVIEQGSSVHVGCQLGADKEVLLSAMFRNPLSLMVFAVAPVIDQAPHHVLQIAYKGAHVVLGAGGSSAPIPARYLLRSIAAFQGCESAVFFSPGPGSLAVARECIKSGLPVFAFGEYPAPVPSSVGFWVESSFVGFACWQWQVTVMQAKLF